MKFIYKYGSSWLIIVLLKTSKSTCQLCYVTSEADCTLNY